MDITSQTRGNADDDEMSDDENTGDKVSVGDDKISDDKISDDDDLDSADGTPSADDTTTDPSYRMSEEKPRLIKPLTLADQKRKIFSCEESVTSLMQGLEMRSVDITLDHDLHPHQLKAVQKIQALHRNQCNAMLSDGCGSGKTAICIAVAKAVKEKYDGTTLVVVPASIFKEWKQEIKKFWGECVLVECGGDKYSQVCLNFESWTPKISPHTIQKNKKLVLTQFKILSPHKIYGILTIKKNPE